MIRIYYKDLSGDCSYEQSLAMYGNLPEERKEKIDRLKNRELAGKKIQISDFLIKVLCKETGLAKEQLFFVYGKQGKPSIDYSKITMTVAKKIEFNMSHSGDYVVIAVHDKEIGVDIEHKTKSCEAIAKRFFCEKEYNQVVGSENEEDKKRCFLEIWTQKEAYVKCLGEGLRIPLDSFCVIDEDSDTFILSKEKTNIASDYVVAVCAKDGEKRYEIVQL